jgi:hypothetical protein
MDKSLLLALEERRPQIRARWETLLRIERVETPLANPDTLVFMFDHTLDAVLNARPGRPEEPLQSRPRCRCDCNPMRVYYFALEQALMETLIHLPAGQPALSAKARVAAVTELCTTLRRIARQELAVFDQICVRRRRRRRPTAKPADYAI